MANLKDPTNQAKTDFLLLESRVGLTFALLAQSTMNDEKRTRVTHFAREAYDTASRLRNRVQMNKQEDDRLTRNLLRLKDELQLLGETF